MKLRSQAHTSLMLMPGNRHHAHRPWRDVETSLLEAALWDKIIVPPALLESILSELAWRKSTA